MAAAKTPKKCKERDLGTPTVIVRYMDETPEQIRQNQKGVENALNVMWGKTYGLHLKNFNWSDKPDNYGVPRVSHPEI